MARLFIRHEATEVPVIPGSRIIDGKTREGWHAFFVDAAEVSEIDVCHICFVYKGECWVGRNKSFFNSGRRAGILCVSFNDDPSGHLMVLADALLN